MLLITLCRKFCNFCKLIMPKFLSQLNYEESKLNSELQIRRQKKKSSRRVLAEPFQFRKGCEFSQPYEMLQEIRNPMILFKVANFHRAAKLSSTFFTHLTFLYNFWCFPELPFMQ